MFAALPRCDRTSPRSCCPDCRDGNPCPLDTLHQVVAVAECGYTHDGHINPDNIYRLVGQRRGGAYAWTRAGDTDVAGYLLWLLIDYLQGHGGGTRTSSILDEAHGLGLTKTEPRLAVLQAQSLLNRGRMT